MGATRRVTLDDDTPHVLTVMGELSNPVGPRSTWGVVHPQLRTTLWKTVDVRWMAGGPPRPDLVAPPAAEVVHRSGPPDVHTARTAVSWDNTGCPHNPQPLLLLRLSLLHKKTLLRKQPSAVCGDRPSPRSRWRNRGPDDEPRADVLTWFAHRSSVRRADTSPRRSPLGASPGLITPGTFSAVEGVAHEDPRRA